MPAKTNFTIERINMKTTIKPLLVLLIYISTYFYSCTASAADTYFKPFILAQSVQSTDINKITADIKAKITHAGFEVVGEYSPVETTHIIIISSPKLREYAEQSRNGVYGAVQRVSLTVVNNATQVAFTNPTYMAHAYRLKTDLADITQSLKTGLGFVNEFGSDKGLTKNELRDYQYKIMMPDFGDRLELADYPNQEEAVKGVLKALQKNEGGVSKVYQVDLKGTQETLIGVHLKENTFSDCSSDRFIMSKIDFKDTKSSAHLPYEMIIQKGRVFALFAEFRIAISFPDLSMMGDNSFFSIMCAPGTIKKALTLGAGGNPDE